MKFILLSLIFISTLYSQIPDVQNSIGYFEQIDSNQNINILEKKFTKLDPKHSNFGFSMSTYWLKIDLKNNTKNQLNEVLYFPYPLLDYIDIYEKVGNKLELKREYGDLRVYNNDGNIPDPSFMIMFKHDESKTYYFKIKTEGSMNINLLIDSHKDFTSHEIEKSIATSFYFGAVFIMLIYNFILFLFIRDKTYLFYLLFHLDYFFFLLSLHGIGFTYIWPQTPFLNTFMVPLLMSTGSSLAIIFTIEFLDLKTTSQRLYKYLLALFVLNVIMTFTVLVISYHSSVLYATLISLISIVSILATGLYSHFKSKNPYAKFFIFAWGSLLMGIFIIHFRNLGILPVNLFTSYSPFIGAFLELTLLSIALAYRYNMQRLEIANKDTILFKQSRLASMGEMINNIAHQWRQPLNRINISLAVIKKVVEDKYENTEFLSKKIKDSEKNIEYMSQTINDFANFFAPDKKKNTFNIYNSVKKAITLVDSRLEDITIHMPEDKNTELYCFENEYIQVMLVILNNAVDNFNQSDIKNKEIQISIKNSSKYSSLIITDNGGGISKKNINFIFDPYFTTKFKNEGTGLGLYMAKMLVENSMQGKLEVFSQNINTRFEITHKKDS